VSRRREGHRQELYGTADRELLGWTIVIDPEFSLFYRRLHQAAKEKNDIVIDLNELAFNLFLLKHSFLNHQALIIHAAGGSLQGKGLVFSAPSGTGKSTLSRLLMQDQRHQLFSEERLIIRLIQKKWHVWGTPWQGEGGIAVNKQAPLAALVFLRQAETTAVRRAAPEVAFRSLLQTVSIPWYSKKWTSRGLTLTERLLQTVPAYELFFRPDESVLDAVAGLIGEV